MFITLGFRTPNGFGGLTGGPKKHTIQTSNLRFGMTGRLGFGKLVGFIMVYLPLNLVVFCWVNLYVNLPPKKQREKILSEKMSGCHVFA